MKRVTCIRNGESIVFAYAFPYFLQSVDGVSEYAVDVTTQRSGVYDGEYYAGGTAGRRNIVITAQIRSNFEETRQKLYSFFQPRVIGTLIYQEDSAEEKQIDYYPESVVVEPDGRMRTVTVSLICPDPMFRATTESVVEMAGWKPLLRFPFVYAPPIKVAERTETRIVNIHNPTNIPTGLRIRFESAGGMIKNPGLEEIQRGESFRLKYTLDGITGWAEVSTGKGKKRVDANDPQVVSRGMIWTPGDDWLQLEPGDNVYRYIADEGVDQLDVRIAYRLQYRGA